MTSTIMQVSRTGRKLAVQAERLYGGKVKIIYNVHQIASMVSEQQYSGMLSVGYQK